MSKEDNEPIIIENTGIKNVLEGLRSKEFQEFYFKQLEEEADWECEICPNLFPQNEKKHSIYGWFFCESCWKTYKISLENIQSTFVAGIRKIQAHYKDGAADQ